MCILQKILKLIQPAANFGPSQQRDRERYYASLDEFDWLRLRAVKAGLDWRSYKRMQTTNAASKTMADDPLTATVNMTPNGPQDGECKTVAPSAPSMDPPAYGVWLTNGSTPGTNTNGTAATAGAEANGGSHPQSESKC